MAELLILVLPLVGATVAVVRAFGAQRRRTDEPAREVDGARPPEARAGADNQAARWRSIRRVLDEHSRTDERWLDYELDVAKLLDFPLMTDMRDPLTIAFHKAKLRADFLRPAKAEDLLDDPDAAAHYLAAVEDYVTAFNAAEARRPAGAAPTSPAPTSNELPGRRACSGWRRTPRRRRTNASAPTMWPVTNSRVCWCCRRRPGRTSSARSPGRSRVENPSAPPLFVPGYGQLYPPSITMSEPVM